MRRCYWVLFLGALFRPAAGEEALPVGFLEFVGEWEDEQGRWVDPLDWFNAKAKVKRAGLDENEEQREGADEN